MINFFGKDGTSVAHTMGAVFLSILLVVGGILLWASIPLEVFDHETGDCQYQLEVSSFGFGEDKTVPCGTHHEMGVQRVDEILM